MTRYHDWPARLEAFLARHKETRFAYGSWDCCLFACGAIEAMAGIDPASGFRGLYHSQAEAQNAIREIVGSASVRKIAEHLSAAHGMRYSPAGRLGRGDLALIKRPRDYSLGIVDLTGQKIIVLTRTGLTDVPLSMALKGWHV